MSGGEHKRSSGTGVVLAVALCLVQSAAAQVASPPALEEWFPRLRPGQWIKVEGRAAGPSALRATELKFLPGDRDESQVTAAIVALDPATSSFRTTLGVRVRTDQRTEFQDRSNTRSRFAALQPGMRVEAEGKVGKDGTLAADEVEIERSKRSGAPPDDDEITGRIESVDARGRQVVVLGVTVSFDERTRLKSPIPD